MNIIHVSPDGNDTATGGPADPLRHVQAAFVRARPGDIVRIAPGMYRERIDPPRGGLSNDLPITVEPRDDVGGVVLCGSEEVSGWIPQGNDLWLSDIPHSVFGNFNPFADVLRGQGSQDTARPHQTAAVYFQGCWLPEAADELELRDTRNGPPRWFARVMATHTRLLACLPGANPNRDPVEVNARQTVFYPSRPGINHITVRGLSLRHAATPWVSPATGQIGLIGSNWSRGWIIEDCEISHAACAGISLGKYNDPEDFGDRPVAEWAGKDTYHGTIDRALKHGWNMGNVGGHTVRRNHIHNCEVAGICGSFGAINCQITHNNIHHIHVRRAFPGREMAGIQFHGALNTHIAHNHVHHCNRGLWLDGLSQGTRVHGNVFEHNGPDSDISLDFNHGPMVLDHNLLLSPRALVDGSDGSLFVHNFFLGTLEPLSKFQCGTPCISAIPGICETRSRNHRILNNLFGPKSRLSAYEEMDGFPKRMEGNVELEMNPRWSRENGDRFPALPPLANTPVPPVEGATLGRTAVADLPYETPAGDVFRFECDIAGRHRPPGPTLAGPFAGDPAGICLSTLAGPTSL